MITNTNWNYSFYKTKRFKAFIALCGVPFEDSTKTVYSVTVTEEEDNKEVIQKDLDSVEEATALINDKYGHWEFVDGAHNTGSSTGCSTCSAH